LNGEHEVSIIITKNTITTADLINSNRCALILFFID